MRTPLPCGIFALVFVLASACAGEAPETPPAGEETPAMEEPMATAGQDSVTYSFALTGAAVVPGPGDEDGSGAAQVTFLPAAQGGVCYEITVADVGDVAAVHVHTGSAGESGAPVLDLNVPANGLSGCVGDVAADLLAQIQANPSAYYLNVHTNEFAGGAVRGQLAES